MVRRIGSFGFAWVYWFSVSELFLGSAPPGKRVGGAALWAAGILATKWWNDRKKSRAARKVQLTRLATGLRLVASRGEGAGLPETDGR